jgi:hypothetical protein
MEILLNQPQKTSGGTTIGTTEMLLNSQQILKLVNMLSPSTDLKIAVTEISISNTKSTPTSVLLTTAHKELCAPQLNLDFIILVTCPSLEPMKNGLNSSNQVSKTPTKVMVTVELTTQHSQLETQTCVVDLLNTSSGDMIST